ncbi:MAG TPA: hypothetical protein VIY69_12995 [Candidatus Acidoferrales bacterium]
MDEKTALHTAARRYCQERFSRWVDLYGDLQRREKWQVQRLFEPGWDYSDEAWGIFPRYRFAKNTLVEIERLVAYSFLSLPEVRDCLIAAAGQAEIALQNELANNLAQRAMHEEAEDFKVYVQNLTTTDLIRVEPLPYRRVLGKQEREQLWAQLRGTWAIESHYWFPLIEAVAPSNILYFHTDYFQRIGGHSLLREALREHGVSTVFLVHEFGDPDYEIELGIFEPSYRDGGEQYSTSKQMDWIVYASHESSITIGGGWLIHVLRALHPECLEHTYRGPYSTPDLRGSWEASQGAGSET